MRSEFKEKLVSALRDYGERKKKIFSRQSDESKFLFDELNKGVIRGKSDANLLLMLKEKIRGVGDSLVEALQNQGIVAPGKDRLFYYKKTNGTDVEKLTDAEIAKQKIFGILVTHQNPLQNNAQFIDHMGERYFELRDSIACNNLEKFLGCITDKDALIILESLKQKGFTKNEWLSEQLVENGLVAKNGVNCYQISNGKLLSSAAAKTDGWVVPADERPNKTGEGFSSDDAAQRFFWQKGKPGAQKKEQDDPNSRELDEIPGPGKTP